MIELRLARDMARVRLRAGYDQGKMGPRSDQEQVRPRSDYDRAKIGQRSGKDREKIGPGIRQKSGQVRARNQAKIGSR